MKFTFRLTLLSILTTLLLATVAGLGYLNRRNERFMADDLSSQVLEQAGMRIDQQLNALLLNANHEGALDRQLVKSGQMEPRDFVHIAPYWLGVLNVHPELTRLSLGLEDTGEWSYVRRLRSGQLVIGELRKQSSTGKLELRNYHPEDYPGKPYLVRPNRDADDARTHP
jgi:hypothetical protein